MVQVWFSRLVVHYQYAGGGYGYLECDFGVGSVICVYPGNEKLFTEEMI